MIISGQVVTLQGVVAQQIEVDPAAGLITRLGLHLGAADWEFSGLIFPGFIDSHVHSREFAPPQQSDVPAWRRYQDHLMRETWVAAARAALQGGVTAWLDMPDHPEPPMCQATHTKKWTLMRDLPVTAFPAVAIGPNSEPVPGAPHQLVIGHSPSALTFASANEAAAVLARYRGCHIIIPCKGYNEGGAADGRSRACHTPEAQEIRTITTALDWKDRFALNLHLAHISAAASLETIIDYNRGKSADSRVTCDVTPHHLFFSTETLNQSDSTIQDLLLTNPPLRSELDRRRLLSGLMDGDIDLLASDHEPHTLTDKLRLHRCGVPHLDTMGGFVGWLLQVAGFTPVRIAECFSAVPAHIWREVFPGHGQLAPGKRADITVLDPDVQTSVPFPGRAGLGAGRQLCTRCGWSPFGGRELPGSIRAVFVGGDLRYRWPTEESALLER